VDVDLKSEEVQEVYGHAPNGSVWTRIDHCLFDEPFLLFAQHSEVITDPAYCLDRCLVNANCYGVNVVPLMAPSSTYDFKTPGAVFPHVRGADIYVPWGRIDSPFNATRDQFMAAASADRFMCYIVRPKQITDVTQTEYLVSNDPTDPVFHSTCYLKFVGRSFTDYEANYTAPDVDVGWRYNHQCISCKEKAENDFTHNMLPHWNVADKCVNCFREPAQGVTSERPPRIVVANNTLCDGHNGVFSQMTHRCGNISNCTIRLGILNRPNNFITAAECRILASQNSSCSNVYYHFKNPNSPVQGECWCYTKDPCCRSCSRRTGTNWFVYELESPPDPTCAGGRLSDDRRYCCSSTCGVGLCTWEQSSTSASVGFCGTNYITRSCAQYGPPCIMP